MPPAFLGARLRSVMMALRGSFGSTSPYARPISFSYCPTVPNAWPSNVGDSVRVMSMRVMPPAAGACGCAALAMGGKPAVTVSKTLRTALRNTSKTSRTSPLAERMSTPLLASRQAQRDVKRIATAASFRTSYLEEASAAMRAACNASERGALLLSTRQTDAKGGGRDGRRSQAHEPQPRRGLSLQAQQN